MSVKEDINTPLIVLIAVISAIMLVVVAVGVQAWFLYEENTESDRKFADSRNTELLDLKNDATRNITSSRWIDKDKRVVTVPIDIAMRMVIQNNGKLPSTQPAK